MRDVITGEVFGVPVDFEVKTESSGDDCTVTISYLMPHVE